MLSIKVINTKFEEEEGEFDLEIRDPHGVKLWKAIRKEWDLFYISSQAYLVVVG